MCMDFSQLGREIAELERAGVDELHFDIMDGAFVPNITMGFEAIRAARKVTKLPFTAHLMIVQPERYIHRFAEEGCKTITIHAESTRHPHRAIQQIRDSGAAPGLALGPATPLYTANFLVGQLQKILVMAVEPGFVGQRAIPDISVRIEKVKQLVTDRSVHVAIGVDGNVSAENVDELVRAGASFLVLGTSSIFNQPVRPGVALRSFRDRINNATAGLTNRCPIG